MKKNHLTPLFILLLSLSNILMGQNVSIDTTSKKQPNPSKPLLSWKDSILYELIVQDSTINYFPDDYVEVKITKTAGFELAKVRKDTTILWIEGIPYPKIKPLFFNNRNSSIIFKLTYDTAASSPWKLFYSWPKYWNFEHQVSLNLGNKTHIYHEYLSTRIILCSSSRWMLLWYLILIPLFILIFKYSKKGLLRDTSLFPSNGVIITEDTLTRAQLIAEGKIQLKDLPHSLARFQFLFWLIIIYISIIHIWVITDSLASPSGTVLLLLGISGTTLFIGQFIDGYSDPSINTISPSQSVQNFYNSSLPSKGFFYDMINDGKGVSLHRLQLLIFTIFLGFYFICFVLYGLIMPQFSKELLALMGISSSTYAGIKALEK